jgi:hypothetical protein
VIIGGGTIHHNGKGCPRPSVSSERFVPTLPRSVGLGPVFSPSNGAFVIAPSALCHSHWMPQRWSYATKLAA